MFRHSDLTEHHERLRHDLRVVRAERDSVYRQIEHLRVDYRAERERNDRLRGENRTLVERLLKAEGSLAD